MNQPAKIALVYVLLASLGVILIARMMPPLQNADEASHAYRADQISHFELVSHRLDERRVGGTVDSGLLVLNAKASPMEFHRDVKISRDLDTPVSWGSPVQAGFDNTAIYPPFFYFPAALVAAWSRHFAIPLPHALILMRLATGAVSVALGAAAIALAGSSAIWLFAILTLPMSLALGAAVSQDGLMLGCTSLAAGLHIHMRQQSTSKARTFILLCILLALVALARPPCAAFALLILTANVPVRWRIAGCLSIPVSVLCWSFYNVDLVVLPIPAEGVVNPKLQLLSLMGHPAHMLAVFGETWRQLHGDLAQNFVGTLGWLDVDLPFAYHRLARVIMITALLATVLMGKGKLAISNGMAALAAIVISCFGICLIQYMTWTPLGAPVIGGIQGRYFLPPALLMAIALARPLKPQPRIAYFPLSAVLMAPSIAIPITAHALLLRYYF